MRDQDPAPRQPIRRHTFLWRGHDLQLRELSSDSAASFAPEDEVWVRWDADKTQLLVLES
ncbi:hypothetical protein [Arthrobacter sp. ISL-69]|uniref:hypothetical protein n=1 Tax=Arthrobacter sp. ISL-69 TaxID=2819113 RepID=UPI001BEB97C8|nr:hypothetical protein [Arthrobacter sp. ISL-69]MBT2536097.1 hypothetical protein [Arthrobacter sp. ISL-69]